MLSEKATNTNFIVFDLTHDLDLNPRSTALEASTLTITPLMQFNVVRWDIYIDIHQILYYIDRSIAYYVILTGQ
jgi:hypothetical protein